MDPTPTETQPMTTRSTLRPFLLTLCLLALSTRAHAHAGHDGTSGLVSGFSHPLTGLDHLLAMIAVGLWGAQRGGRAMWIIPASFVGIMTLGGLLGLTHVSLPMVEPAILASVIVLGVAIAVAKELPVYFCAGLVGLFALFHGYAHGVEMPTTASRVGYGAGFLFSTALLHAAGIALGMMCRSRGSTTFIRYAGAVIALAGIGLSVSR